jgi:hypothetical protein
LCASLGLEGKALKVAFLFAFFGFLRQSNLAPPTSGSFDRPRHTRRADVSVHASGIIVTLRWTKTLQDFSKSFHIPLPSILGSPLCPTAAYLDFVKAAPGRSQDPLLSFPYKGRSRIVLSAGYLRKELSNFLTSLKLPSYSISLHSLRRRVGGGHGSLQGRCHTPTIQKHGTWVSGAVKGYLPSLSTLTGEVPSSLARAARAYQICLPTPK